MLAATSGSAPRPPRRRSRLRAPGVIAAAVLPLLAVGCSSSGDTAADGKTFTYLSYTDIVTEWDPGRSYSNEVIALQNLYETLTRYNARTKKVEPLLATGWKSSEGGRTWTFTLRDGVSFHSGRPLTAESVKAAVERTIKLKAGAAYLWEPVKKITAVDRHTVRFTLSHPAPLDLISSSSYAAYIYEIPKNAKDFKAKSYGTGPYTVDSWRPGSENELGLTAFKKYWHGWKGDHYRKASFQVVPQASTMAKLMRSGEGDYAMTLPPQLLDTLRGKPDLTVLRAPSWQNLFALLNTEKKPLNDVRVRRAIAHAIDYQELITTTKGAFKAADGVIPAGLLGHSTDLDLPAHDSEQARKLLKAAGYGKGSGRTLKLELTYTKGNDSVRTMVNLMKAQLRPLGVDLRTEALPWESAQWPRAKKKDPEDRQDILLMFWWPDDPEPLSWFRSMFRSEEEISFNLSYYSNPRFDSLVDKVGSLTATDRAKAERTYREMQNILIKDSPALFLGTQVNQRALNSSVKGFSDNPSYANVVFLYDCTPR